MPISITDFKQKFNGGTRQNRFLVSGVIPYSGDSITKFHIIQTQIPQISTQTLEYNYFGRKAYYPGETQNQTWSIGVLDDTGSGDLWKKFSNWHNRINNHVTNFSTVPTSTSDYKAYNWEIQHLQLNGDNTPPLKRFKMHGCWPRTIADINLNMANPNSINQFMVVFLFDWMEIGGVTDSGTGSITSA